MSSVLESVKANSLASKINNIDGKFLPRRYTTYQEPLKDVGSSKSTISNVKDKVDTIRKPSFALVVHEKPQKTIIKIKEMRNEVNVNGAAVTIPMEAVESVNARFVNTLYGYFIDDRLAFPLVENYVKNTWAKYGLKRIQLHEEFFLFQFNTKEDMESVMENGPWLIRHVPLLLNEWTSNTLLKKMRLRVFRFRSAYARVLIEIATDVELVKSLVIAIHVGYKEEHTFATIDIEYEWTHPRCASFRIFDHVSEKCPKLPKVALSEKVIDDGFIEGKSSKVSNEVASKESTNKGPTQVTTNNFFSALSGEADTNLKDDDHVNAGYQNPVESQFVNDNDEDVDEGMNLSHKQNEVQQVIYDNKLSVCTILESHVATRNLERLCKHVFKNWNWISNAMSCLKGTRIIVGWNQNDVDVAVIHQDPQVIHTRIWIKADIKEFFCSFVYAFNKYIHRWPLWNGLCLHKNFINNRPWCLLGDFNAPFFVEDTSIGSSTLDVTMRAGPSLSSIITHLMPIAKRKSSKSCISKLVVAAAAYFIWQQNAQMMTKVMSSKSARQRYLVLGKGFIDDDKSYVEQTCFPKVKMNKLDGISESLIERMRRSRELRDASLNKHGASKSGANPKPLKSILKHIQSPSKEGRKVNVMVLNDGESRISSTLNTSPNVNVSATDFEKDTTAKVQPASNKVHNSFASALKHKVNLVAEIVELRNEECVEGAAVTLPLAAIEEVSSRFENNLYGYFVEKRLAYQVVENYVKSVWSKYGLIRIQLH
nr:hypothetical protein [Tanacetum cinerariifolium]